mmetsp:Transcript_1593/g.3506  ORF Transcript_1593/g.3506 Transcript_1593/m.3506 type:complete len:238 (-) Transcript_1593:47-760(-)
MPGMAMPPGFRMPPGYGAYDDEDDEDDEDEPESDDDALGDMSEEDMMMMMMMMNSGGSLDDMPPELLSKMSKMMGGGNAPIPSKPPTASSSKAGNKKKNNKKKKNKGKKGKHKVPTPSSYMNKAAGQESSENKPPSTPPTKPQTTSFPANPSPASSGEPFTSLREISDGMDVIVRGSLRGKVTFSGSVHYAKGDWVGVVLEEPAGKNNGTVKGVEYFSCDPQHGLFVRPSELCRAVT